MGNQSSTSSSSSHLDIDRKFPFSRNAKSLGLSRHELDKRCQPSGLYGSCHWDEKAIRRLIGDGRIAARLKGKESPYCSAGVTEECPICFLYYSEVNTTTCCHASMCSECFLQVRPQKEKESTCPFCNSEDFSVVCAKKKAPDTQEGCPALSDTSTSLSDSSGVSSSSINGSLKKKSAASVAPNTPPQSPKAITKGFGSHLEKDERFQRMRKRSESFASSDGTSTPKREQEIIHSIAMTPQERQKLEEEMKAQHNHPLILRLDAEAHERRLENDRAYQNSSRSLRTSDSSTSRNQHLARRVRATRDLEQLVNFFDQADGIDDMAALETAILYTRLNGQRQGSNEGATDTDNSDSNSNSNREQQAEGFPLLRTLLTGQVESNNQGSSTRGSLHLRTSRRQRNQFMRSGLASLAMRSRGMGDHAMDTASMMMRGISEEEQMAMAIAASMRDQEAAAETNNDEEETNEEDGESSNEAEESANDSEGSSSDSSGENNSQDSSSSSDNNNGADVAEDSSSSPSPSPAMKQQGNGDEASTITELARVVTDTCAPDSDTIRNGIAA